MIEDESKLPKDAREWKAPPDKKEVQPSSSVSEELTPEQKYQNRTFINKTINGIANAHVWSLDKIQQTYALSDTQFQVVREFAYDENGKPKDDDFRRKAERAIKDLSSKGIHLADLPPRAVIDLMYKAFDRLA